MELPWYSKLEELVAPTEKASNIALVAVIIFSAYILLKGTAVAKAAFVVYLISP